MDLDDVINFLKDTGHDCEDPLDTCDLAQLVLERLTTDDPTDDHLIDIIHQIHSDYRNAL